MKKLFALLLYAFLLIITACSCSNESVYSSGNESVYSSGNESVYSSGNEPACDLEYNMNDFDYFSEIFDSQTDKNWETMGEYTILLSGFDTPVVVAMDGVKVVSVTAYGKTAQVNIESFQDSIPAEIDRAQGVIIVNKNLDYSGRSWLITKDEIYTFNPNGDISTQIFANQDGTLRYTRYWGEYVSSFDQWDTAPLELCDSRDEFLYENGSAKIINGKVVLTPAKTVCVSDEFDLDSIFADAKRNGMYEEYSTVDELLESNGRKR